MNNLTIYHFLRNFMNGISYIHKEVLFYQTEVCFEFLQHCHVSFHDDVFLHTDIKISILSMYNKNTEFPLGGKKFYMNVGNVGKVVRP